MAGTQLVRKLIGAAAREAPELERGALTIGGRATLNIGLDIPGGGRLAPEEALAALERVGVRPIRATVAQSDTEPTLVLELPRSLKPEEAHAVSAMLQQEAIAQVDEAGRGDLFGPMADKWRPFNGDYFITGDGKRLTQQIMEAGNVENVPGGVEKDPVMAKLDEIAASLKPKEPTYAGGGLVKKVAEKLLGAADEVAANPLRLYHGRSFKEPIKQLDPLISPDQLGIHLGDPETASKFATIRDNVKPKDAGARVIPLDVDIKNPLRLSDNKGKWSPDDVYKQLADRGVVPWDEEKYKSLKYRSEGMVQDTDGSWIDAGDGTAELDAMLEVQDMIRAAGHDGVVYTNRYELPGAAAERAKGRDRLELNSMSDEDFLKEFPEATDSYIAFRNEQLKSPFGEGPGVGYAGGGRVEMAGGGWLPKVIKGGVDAVEGLGAKAVPDLNRLSPEMRQDYLASKLRGAGINSVDDFWQRIRDYMVGSGVPNPKRIDNSTVAQQVDQAIPVYRGDVDKYGPRHWFSNHWPDRSSGRDDGLYGWSPAREVVGKTGLTPTRENIESVYEALVRMNGPEPQYLNFEEEVQKRIAESKARGEWDVTFEPGSSLDKLAKKRAAERAEKAAQEARDAAVVNPEDPPQKFDRGGLAYKIGKGLVDLLDFSGVAGKPKTVKIPGRGEFAAAPIEELDAAAESYMKRHGIPGTHRIGEYPEFDEEFAKRIATEFDGLKHAPNDPAVRRTYDALLEETMAQYKALEDSGLDVRFLKDGMADPYAKSPSMGYADIVDNGRLWVFPTEQGYGSGSEVLEHPLLKKVGRVGDKENAVANDAFRVVHDAYGHFGPGNPFFRAPGEDRAWQHHARMYSDEALPAMSAETRGQNSWVNSGPLALANKGKSGADTIYADQKAVAMPSWVYERDLGRKPKFADGGPAWSEGDEDIKTYEAMRDYVSKQPADIRSMTHIGDKPTRNVTVDMPLFGGEFNLGPEPYDTAGIKSGALQTAYDMKTLPAYFSPFAPAAVAWDLAEGISSGDPLQMGLAVASSIPGKAYKAAGKAVMNAGKKVAAPGGGLAAAAYANTDDAEAGMFGLLSKWGSSHEGQDALREAIDMIKRGADPEQVRMATNWFKDLDGHWKFELPSAGGSADLKRPGRGDLADYYYDPNLFKQYPDMKTLKLGRATSEGASYYPDLNRIVVGDISDPWFNKPEVGGLKGVLDHEIYHAKSAKEGWAQGTNKYEARSAIVRDIKRFLGSKGDPKKQVMGSGLSRFSPEQMSSLASSRYEAEMGEALANREAMRRDFGWDQIAHGVPPTNDIAVPKAALFDSAKYATPSNYSELIKWHNSKVKK